MVIIANIRSLVKHLLSVFFDCFTVLLKPSLLHSGRATAGQGSLATCLALYATAGDCYTKIGFSTTAYFTYAPSAEREAQRGGDERGERGAGGRGKGRSKGERTDRTAGTAGEKPSASWRRPRTAEARRAPNPRHGASHRKKTRTRAGGAQGEERDEERQGEEVDTGTGKRGRGGNGAKLR